MNILITGATGFIGSELMNHLKNHKILGLSSTINSKKIIKLPLSNRKLLNLFLSKHNFDIVIHLAAKVENNHLFDNPMNMFNANCQKTINLLDACVQNKIKKFIFISGHNVYGKSKYFPIDEEHPTNPLTNYGITKLIGEQITKMYHLSYGLQVLNLRVSSVYGIGQPQERIIPKMILHAIKNKPMLLHKYRNGFQLLDLVHIKDVCHAIELACESKKSFGTYNIASGKTITIKKISKMISKLSKKNIFQIQECDFETNHYFYNISKSKKDLNYSPRYFLDQNSLSEFIDYYKK